MILNICVVVLFISALSINSQFHATEFSSTLENTVLCQPPVKKSLQLDH